MGDAGEVADLKRRLADLERGPAPKRRSGCASAALLTFLVVGVLIVVIGLLSTCTPSRTVYEPPSDTRRIMDAEDAIKAKLRDPSSARFDGQQVSRRSGNPVVCGYVNAKNGFGGMSGRTRFIAGGAIAMTEDEDREAFPLVWDRTC